MLGPPKIDYVRVFNKTGQTVVWMDGELEGPPLEPLTWTERVPTRLAERFGNNGDFAVEEPSFEAAKVKPMRPRPLFTDDGRMHLLLASPIDAATGYGYLSLKIAEQLALEDNLNLSMHKLAYWHTERTPPHIREIMGRKQEVCEWALAVTIPSELPNIPARHIILYTMWETRELPKATFPGDDWAALCNNWAEAVIVPCPEQKAIYERAGVTIPIYVVPIGLDGDIYYPRDVEKEETFTIWTHGRMTSRKSPIELITDVLWPYLGDKDHWQLRIKTWAGALGAGKFRPIINDERVVVMDGVMPDEEMARLMSAAHVGVYLSKFEGWGMPFREALACGLVTLPSLTSGHIVDCNPSYNVPIPLDGVIDAGDGYSGSWDVPDWEAAGVALRGLYEIWEAGRWREVVTGQEGSKWIRHRRSWGRMAHELVGVINETHNRLGG